MNTILRQKFVTNDNNFLFDNKYGNNWCPHQILAKLVNIWPNHEYSKSRKPSKKNPQKYKLLLNYLTECQQILCKQYWGYAWPPHQTRCWPIRLKFGVHSKLKFSVMIIKYTSSLPDKFPTVFQYTWKVPQHLDYTKYTWDVWFCPGMDETKLFVKVFVLLWREV